MNPKYKNSFFVKKYFGKYIDFYMKEPENLSIKGKFFRVIDNPIRLEERLKRIEPWGQTKLIVNEIGDISDLTELDRRLMDVWSELRTIDLLAMEGFKEIKKVKERADLVARCQDNSFAFQVK